MWSCSMSGRSTLPKSTATDGVGGGGGGGDGTMVRGVRERGCPSRYYSGFRFPPESHAKLR